MGATEPVIYRFPDKGLHGRRKIYTCKPEITEDNVVSVVSKAFAIHQMNKAEIQYLYDYYRGKQDVCYKEKVVRPEINNKVIVNRANEIVTFKTAYLLGEPVQYISAGRDDTASEQVALLNEYMRSEGKDSKDKEIVDWMHIAGLGVRMTLSDPIGEEEGSPACIYTLDPRHSFCIYYSGVGERQLAGVIRQRDENGKWKFCVYTKDWYYEITAGKITKSEPHSYGSIPIVEYPNNTARMGAFEPVIPILNAINTIESNRVDSIQDFVNAFDVFQNCEIDGEKYAQLSKGGMAIQIKGIPGMEAKVYRIASELNQSNTQNLVDDLYDSALTICGMPNRNGGSSTSDTGTAVIYRDGFAEAESRAKDTEKMFIASERDFLRVFLRICQKTTELDLSLSQVKTEFTRKNLSNTQSKAQVLSEMLNNSKIHPKLAFQYSGMFTDSEEAYRMSMEYYEMQQKAMQETLKDALNDGEGDASNAENRESVSSGGQGSGTAEQKSNTAV